MKILVVIFFCLLLVFSMIMAQENKTITETSEVIPLVKLGENIQVKFGGFVRAEYYIDSRKTVGAVDDLFSFFADKHLYDSLGNDQNDIVRSNLSVQGTRFNALFTGPDVFKAKTSAFFEFDFTGGNTVNVRMRHAFIKLNWTKHEVLIGKTWNPLTANVLPSVIGLHTGIPYQAFARGDQLRYTYKPGKLNILAAVLYQSEHKSFSYVNTTTYEIGQSMDNVRANPIPDLHLQIHYKTNSVFTGIVSEYKIIRPSTTTTGTEGIFNTKQTVSSFALGWFGEYKYKKLTLKGNALFGQNLSEAFLQGGYAVTSIDTLTGHRTYAPSNAVTSWVNVCYGSKLVVGFFGGYQKNLGFSEQILSGKNNFLGRWQDIDHIYRIAPSVKFITGRLIFAAEIDVNVVAYGSIDYEDYGKVKIVEEIMNVRGLLNATFQF